MSEAAIEESEESFLQALYRGSELIGQGELDEARSTLVDAVAMRPDDPKARNLLGLACFKLGDYEAAEGLYHDLVEENADDATLRVNLGLVYLKTGRFEEAIRELAAAVDLQPDHRRAQNYLGLAYARVGDYAQARECFVAAGSGQMVERMERLLAGEDPDDPAVTAVAPATAPAGFNRLGDDDSPPKVAPRPKPAPRPADPTVAPVRVAEDAGDAAPVPVAAAAPESAAEDEAPAPAAAPEPAAEDDAFTVEDADEDEDDADEDLYAAEAEDENASATDDATTAPPQPEPSPVDVDVDIQDESGAFDPAIAPSRAETAPDAVEQPGPDAPEVDDTLAVSPRSDYVLPARVLEYAESVSLPGAIPAPFAVAGRVIVASIEGDILSRTRRLLAADGSLSFQPEVKRFRGRATDKPFGEGKERMFRVTGSGRLYFGAGARCYTPVKVDGADAYVREEVVLAFEETVSYENGRVPSKVSEDLNLVHLRGKGAVLLETDGSLVSIVVTPEGPLRVPIERLVGWTGLVTPRIVAFADAGGANEEALFAVELAGQGTALLCLPADDA